ncbi:hypothetical protein MSPP1_001102 [Malassezia sp. CBS 17886]|nr:hypothetical protein MSPP1_001102 [Malassezia sp. CBS 17886]
MASSQVQVNSRTASIRQIAADSDTLQFVTHVPLVAGVLQVAHSLIETNSLLRKPLNVGECVADKSLQLVQPITVRLSKPLHLGDEYTYKTLEFVKNKFPYPFTVKWEDLYNIAVQPLDFATGRLSSCKHQAQNLYDTRVREPASKLYEQTGKAVEQLQQHENVYLQRTGGAIASMNDNLTKVAQDWSKKTKSEMADGEQKAQTLVRGLFQELENLQKFALSLSSEGQKRFQPVVDTFASTYKQVASEALDTKVPVQDRVNKVTSYIRSETLPALHKVALANASDAQNAFSGTEKQAASKLSEDASQNKSAAEKRDAAAR